MKTLLKSYLGVLTLLFLVGLATARDKKDFDRFLKSTQVNFDNTASEKFYENLEFTNNKTKEKKKFSDFSEVDRAVYILMQTDVLSHEMEDLYNKWKEELKTAEETPSDENEASKKDVTAYMEKLMELRIKNAEKVESLVANLFKKWPDKFTKDEQEYITKKIKEYHDKEKLVERK